jgi:hypothetical protein
MALVNVLTAFSDSGGVAKLGLVDASRRLVITGDAAAVAVPVSAAALPLPTGAATEATLAAAAASLAVIDDWDESDRAKVNPIAGQVGVQGGSGVVTALTQRVVLATDISLPAGTNNIGDVDIASLPNEGQQTMANSISVAIASDQTAVPISAASLPLPTGAATEVTLAAAAASLSVIDDWDESDRAKVNPIAGQAGVQGGSGVVTALTQRVVLATDVSLPAGTNNIGDVDVLTLPSLPAGTNNIGDVDIVSLPNEGQQTMANSISVAIASDQTVLPVGGNVAHDAADSGNPVKIGGKATTSEPAAVSANNDRVDAYFDDKGYQHVKSRPVEDAGTTPTNINTTYNNTTTSATSADITKQAGTRTMLILFTLAKANTPTDIEFFIDAKDGSNYFPMKTGILAKWIYDDGFAGTTPSLCVEVPAPPTSTFRMRAVATGTDATNTFTVSNLKIFQRT